MLVDQCSAFMCWWIIANYFIYNLNKTKKRNRKDCVCGNGGSFSGCFVGEFVTWNGTISRDPLNKDGRRNEVNGIVNEEVSGFDEIRASHIDLLSVQRMVGVGGCR